MVSLNHLKMNLNHQPMIDSLSYNWFHLGMIPENKNLQIDIEIIKKKFIYIVRNRNLLNFYTMDFG